MKKIRLLIADDHHILLDGLKALLSKQKNIEVVGFYDNGEDLYNCIPANLPIDLILTDINMPGYDGLTLTQKVKEYYPGISIIVLSMHNDIAHIMDMIDAGVDGYLLKNINDTDLLQAIQNVTDGRMAFCPEVSEKISLFAQYEQGKKEDASQSKLTAREIEILKLIAQENSNAQIADILFISERTVETHRKNMMRKTNNKTIVGLLKYAMEHHYI
jgi:DNA-binding NarL/FixJ family response regulator